MILIKKTVFLLPLVVFVLTGCGHQQSVPSTSQTNTGPVIPISLSDVDHVTLNTYLERNPKQPAKSVVISSSSVEREIIDEIDSSKTLPPPPDGSKVVAPEVGPNSVSYKVTVWMNNGQLPRIFRMGSWGGTYDVVYDVNIAPGLSRDLLKKLSSPGTKQN